MGLENFSVSGHDMIKNGTAALGAKGSKVNWNNLGTGKIVAGATAAKAVLASIINAAQTAD